MPGFGQGFAAVREHPALDLAEFEQEFVIGGMRFARLFLAGCQETLGRFSISRLTVQSGVGDGPGGADRTQHIQLIRVKDHLGFQGLGVILPATEAVRPDAMLDGFDLFFRPALGSQDLTCEYCRGDVMFGSGFSFAARRAAAGIVQQGGCPDDLKVCAFGLRQALGNPVDPQDMVKVVDGVGVLIPDARFFNSDGLHGQASLRSE